MAEQLVANLTYLVKRGKPEHSAFIWPIDMVACPERRGFGYVMPLMAERFKSLAQLLKAAEPPGFSTLDPGRHQSRRGVRGAAFAGTVLPRYKFRQRLRGRGLGRRGRHRQRQCWGKWQPGPGVGDGAVHGPRGYPGRKSPSTETDLYSLAIFLFYLFCFGHPLEGAAVEASYIRDDDQRSSEQEILLKHYGRDGRFSSSIRTTTQTGRSRTPGPRSGGMSTPGSSAACSSSRSPPA